MAMAERDVWEMAEASTKVEVRDTRYEVRADNVKEIEPVILAGIYLEVAVP